MDRSSRFRQRLRESKVEQPGVPGPLSRAVGSVLTEASSGIAKCFFCFRDKLPLIFLGRKGQLQNPIGIVIADFAVLQRRTQKRVASSTGADNDFANPATGFGNAFGILRGESFVGVLVGGNDQVCVGGVKIGPKRLKLGMSSVFGENAAAEKSVVPVRQN